MNQAITLWWHCFSVLDVLLLLFYSQLKDDMSPKAVFYINNIIWFLGLDIYHLYLTVKLWTRDMPSIKDVQREIAFYPRKPSILEPRRPMLQNTANAFVGRRDQKPSWTASHFKDMVGSDEGECGNTQPGNSSWKGKKRKERSIKICKTGKVDWNKGQKESKRSTPNSNLTYMARGSTMINLPPVSD